MDNKPIAVWFLVALILGLAGGYFYGDSHGYQRAEANIKKVQEAAANKAGDEAAKAANPFQAANPLEGVQDNPFNKVKSILNPFK